MIATVYARRRCPAVGGNVASKKFGSVGCAGSEGARSATDDIGVVLMLGSRSDRWRGWASWTLQEPSIGFEFMASRIRNLILRGSIQPRGRPSASSGATPVCTKNLIQDMPDRLPVNAGRFHRHMRALVFRQPLRQAQKVRRGRLEGPHFGCGLAIGDKAQAGHHRLLVNVKTATSPMHQLHLLLLHCVVGVGLRT